MSAGVDLRRTAFDSLPAHLPSPRSDREALELCRILACLATALHPGRFFSPSLETTLCRLARSIPSSPPVAYRPDSFLHVATRLYPFGGHTRILERWIEWSPAGETHSLFLTESSFVPVRLQQAIAARHGQISFPDTIAEDPFQCARQLRDIASGVQTVVLHHHMHDVIPVLAFGTESFLRPVVLYNHADFLFWVGGMVADAILDLSSRGQQHTAGRRKRHSQVLPLPVDGGGFLPTRAEKCARRAQHHLPPASVLVLTIGSEAKFYPLAGTRSFLSLIDAARNLDPRLFFAVVGPSPRTAFWRKAQAERADYLRVFPTVPHEELASFCAMADLYLDSYPIPGGTSLLEAAGHGLPIIPLHSPLFAFDSYRDQLTGFAEAPRHLAHLASHPETQDQQTLARRIRESHGEIAWRSNLARLLATSPQTHNLALIRAEVAAGGDDSPDRLDSFLYTITRNFGAFPWRELWKCRLPLLTKLRLLAFDQHLAVGSLRRKWLT